MSTDKRYDYDLFTIGAGSGGVRASRMSAAYGARVAVAEERYLGGTCVNVGCIPKKLLVYGSHFAGDFEDAAGFGWTVGERAFDWPSLIRNKDQEIARLNSIYRGLLESHGVDLFESRARVLDPHTVEVDGRKVTAADILVATGGWPTVPNVPGREHAITSNEAFHLSEMPRRVVIVGGGYIAVEFAGIFNGLGAEVIQLYRGPLFMRGFDIDVRNTLADEMRKTGIDLRFDADIVGIERNGGSLAATLKDGQTLETDAVMFATGRLPNTRGLGIEEIGVELARNGAVVVNERYQTSVPSIWALGDVTDRVKLTPVAIAEAMVFARNLFKGDVEPMHYRNIPSAVFSQPPVGTVGYTEEAARENCGEVDVYRADFRPLKHTLSGRDEKTMMKLIVERAGERVVGCHMVGADAGEIIQGMAVAVNCGATKADFDRTVGIHPTAAEEFVTMREPVAAG
ncbi:MAG: glutathione-disulfide reductase [Deltaproteobacteria bacterium]|nr:glutathione-disulfide reductase [Deltaproteobacteria bacterium]